ncbi:hypothetical protein GCM10012278_20010 [Nonomuraea glycinis]|uniref:Uncharacterized protein n=1 Tax=Nonomuraea glycinis TaxID=2047744 RepID=A0A918A219_9ACTN|nr:hypothetical protein GCM10012278_20010 [Nonomuraea glycinis]
MGGTRLDDAQMVAWGDRIARSYCGGDWEIGRAQAARMVHGDDASTTYRAGVADGALTCGQDGGCDGRGEVDAAVAGQPWFGRRGEAAQDSRRSVERPLPG